MRLRAGRFKSISLGTREGIGPIVPPLAAARTIGAGEERTGPIGERAWLERPFVCPQCKTAELADHVAHFEQMVRSFRSAVE